MGWSVAFAMTGLLLAAVYVGGRREAGRLHITRVEVPVSRLPQALDGLEIIHLTDLHLRGYGPFEQDLLRAVARLDAPIVAVTGDFLAGPGGADALIPLLMEIGRERTVFGVLGNHDHRPPVNTRALANDLARAGVRLLVNSSEIVLARGARLRIAGVDDPHTGRDDLEAALARDGDSRDEPVILLAHSPDVFPAAVEAGVHLVLAGHTHGGQICLPGGYAPWTNSRLGRRFAAGLFRDGPTRMFVSRGIGTVRWNIRLFCPPEIAVVRLVRAADTA